MKQTDESMIAQSREVMAELKEIRGGELLPVDAELAEEILRDVLAHGEHARQQVQGRDGLLPARGGAAQGALYGFLSLYGEVVEVHISVFFLFVRVYIIYGVGRQAARPVPRSPGGELSVFSSNCLPTAPL